MILIPSLTTSEEKGLVLTCKVGGYFRRTRSPYLRVVLVVSTLAKKMSRAQLSKFSSLNSECVWGVPFLLYAKTQDAVIREEPKETFQIAKRSIQIPDYTSPS